jgi:predicted negative regulator of RcsB-dependent stress response
MKIKVLVSLIVLGLIVTVAWSGMGQSQRSARVSYEYQVIDDFSNSDQKSQSEGLKNLNRLAAQGWEVVTVVPESRNYAPKIWLKRAKR